MAHWPGFRFLNLLGILLWTGTLYCSFDAQGNYFIYSPEDELIFGIGNITIHCDDWTLQGQTLSLDTRTLQGRLLGGVLLTRGSEENVYCHEVLFSLFPLRWQGRLFSEKMILLGDTELQIFHPFPEPERLRKGDLYFELGAFRLYSGRKIVGERVVPYLLGAPSLPMKKLLLKRTDIEGRTLLFLEKINYSQQYGLLLDLGFNLFRKGIQGNHHLKLFERALFNEKGPSRGFILEAEDRLVSGEKTILTFNSIFDSDDRAISLRFGHNGSLGVARYTVSQSFSGREGEEGVNILDASLSYNGIERLTPQFTLSTDYRHSLRWQVSGTLDPVRNLHLNLGYEQNRVEHQVSRREKRFFGSLSLSTSVISVDSDFDIVRDQIELRTRRSFNLRCPLPVLHLLERNISFEFVPFYSFSTLPVGDSMQNESNPGFSAALHSQGVLLPWRIVLRPKLDLYHIWDQGRNSKTSFNTFLSLERKAGVFSFAAEYSMASRLTLFGFWVEGQHLNRLGLRMDIQKAGLGGGSCRFSFDNSFKLESVSCTGNLALPWRVRLNGMLIYSTERQRLLSLDIYLERDLLNTFKLRGGYSLALKRFFIDFMQSF